MNIIDSGACRPVRHDISGIEFYQALSYLNSDADIGSFSNLTVFDQANFILMTIVELFCVILSIL